MKVSIQPYDPEWPKKFVERKDHLLQILKGVPIVSIEHVGSTSIPSLPAKPVIDIDIIIPGSSLQTARDALTKAGYGDIGELGIPERFVFRQPGYGRFDAAHGAGRDGEFRYNTYVVIEGCESLRNHLDIKRILLEDHDLREEYALVKTKLADTDFEDIDQYTTGKTVVLCKVLRKAGWSDEELESVMKVNS
ncbi:hypothetical protein N7478_002207 [Penicillium angulare]|uniref:uncharacterized protein n=1 Tax=Penicillium angulare TaxID=116970 RepID=UPI002541987E|nr:uncharacterized protein N7478_002207 [Penicillium angulare]KAJ5289177.1 hypothetical protein N7478_002207 [Penicillium angulare]